MNKLTLWVGAIVVLAIGLIEGLESQKGSAALSAAYVLSWMGAACK